MRNTLLIGLWVGLGFLFSCLPRQPYPEKMQQAEQCLTLHPDSALSYLSALDSTISAEPEETRMYFVCLPPKQKTNYTFLIPPIR